MAVRKPTAGTMIAQHPDNAKAHRVWQPRTCFVCINGNKLGNVCNNNRPHLLTVPN
jgi:hypothetical protein